MPTNVCVQWPNREQALACPRGDIKLVFCSECSFIWNTAFDASLLDYSQAYENSLSFSPVYQDFTKQLVQRLIEKYNLTEKIILDIGCGKGEFLFLFCEMGNNRGVGFDTSYNDIEDEKKLSDRVTIIRDFYSSKYSSYMGDLICSRQVLEHIERPNDFLSVIKDAVGQRNDVVIYFEVPNVSFVLRNLSVWDIIYEHCNYFGFYSLSYLFEKCGFQLIDLYESYDGQFLGIEVTLNQGWDSQNNRIHDLEQITYEVESFTTKLNKQMEQWKQQIEKIIALKKRAVLWGGGARGVSFLNMLKLVVEIPYVVDINPRKHGRYIPGTGQEIISPDGLIDYKPDYIFLMNPLYKNEIQNMLDELQLSSELIC